MTTNLPITFWFEGEVDVPDYLPQDNLWSEGVLIEPPVPLKLDVC